MPVGQPCKVCSLAYDVRTAIDEKLKGGMKVRHVAKWANQEFKLNLDEKLYYNHNQRHVRMISRAVAKLSDGQRERRSIVDTAKAVVNDEKFDAVGYLQIDAISRDIFRTSQRLEAGADEAFETHQLSALANLSGHLLRSAELRGKLGGSISDQHQVNLQFNLNALTEKVVSAMESDPGKRRQVAASLLSPSLEKAPEVDLGLAPEPDGPLARMSGAPEPEKPAQEPPEPVQPEPAPRRGVPANWAQIDALMRGSS